MYSAKELAIARLIKPDIEVAQLDVTDLAVLQLVRKATGGESGVYNATIENGIATFGGVVVSQPLVSLKLNIPVTQTGSGTPSPDNIRDFIGVNGVNIGQTSDYGEYFRGLLNGSYGFVDLGSLNWIQYSSYNLFYAVISDMENPATLQDRNTNMLCTSYKASTGVTVGTIDDKSYARFNNHQLWIRDTDYTDVNSFAESLDGVKFIYPLETPSTPITPQDFATLCQAFGITGNTYQITFGQTVYSAILDVLTGKLSITHELNTIDENSLIEMSSTNIGIFAINNFFDEVNDNDSINCDCYQRGLNRSGAGGVLNYNPEGSFCCNSTSRILYIKDTRFTSVDDYKTWLSTNPVKIAVKLAEPIEIDLTPTVINTLIGDNVIFADVANVTECKYTRK